MNQPFKAWKAEWDLLQQSVPVILEEEEQGWLFSNHIEEMEDIMLQMKWQSNVPGSGAPERVIYGAVQAMENLGYDVREAEALLPLGTAAFERKDMVELTRLTTRIWHLLNHAPKDPHHPAWQYGRYESFADVEQEVSFPAPTAYDRHAPQYLEATYYGWLAQICAGAVGTAVEGYTPEAIQKAFGTIKDYVRKPNTYNDDITYEIAFLKALERKGLDLSSADIAEEWAGLVTFGWSAEEWALKNIKLGIYPPESGKLHNPYREWIGAQMRGAICGMIVPGDYRRAAQYAFMDGVVSHHNNGVLGELFNAMLVAGAYVESDVRVLLRTVIDLLPKRSEYYAVVKFALEQCETQVAWQDAWEPCRKKFDHYNWIHSYPNAAAEVIALWFGKGDFTETISISCHQGYDVDCNAAQIGTVLGIQKGAKALAPHWTKPIGDRLDTYLRRYKVMSIRELARDTVRAAKQIEQPQGKKGSI